MDPCYLTKSAFDKYLFSVVKPTYSPLSVLFLYAPRSPGFSPRPVLAVFMVDIVILRWDLLRVLRFSPVPVAVRSIRRGPVAARLLRSWVRIPTGVWMVVRYECCVLSGRCLCVELITRPEESYRLWCVVMCNLETSRKMRPWPTGGCRAKKRTELRVSPQSLPAHFTVLPITGAV
jgi:hypothetical protein